MRAARRVAVLAIFAALAGFVPPALAATAPTGTDAGYRVVAADGGVFGYARGTYLGGATGVPTTPRPWEGCRPRAAARATGSSTDAGGWC